VRDLGIISSYIIVYEVGPTESLRAAFVRFSLGGVRVSTGD